MPTVVYRSIDPKEINVVRTLFREYADSLKLDLEFQNFSEELATLPGKYAPPQGCILLATVDGQHAGCVALRPLETNIGEMKRLYVRPLFRGSGLGRLLVERLIHEARVMGHLTIRLDTLPSIQENAVSLYGTLNFREIAPYCHNPVPGALFLELKISPNS